MLHHGPGDRLRLGGVDPLALVVGAGIVAEDEPRVLLAHVGAREDHEAVVVELVVRHGDQRLVAAAVVPPQHPLGRSAGAEQPQDALEVGGLAQVLLVGAVGHPVEEARRRELFAVAHDHGLLAPKDRSQGLDRTHLARLVEDHEVEADRAGRDVLRDRQRAHHEDRLDRLDRASRPLHEHADRKVTPLLLEFALEHAQLAAAVLARELLPVPLGDPGPVVVELGHVELAEALDDAGVRGAVELGEGAPLPERQLQPRAVARVLEECREPPARVLSVRRGLGHLRDPGFLGLSLELVEAHHVVGRGDPLVGVLEPRGQLAVGAARPGPRRPRSGRP